MMCCSSLIVTPGDVLKMNSQTQGFSKLMNGGAAYEGASTRKLMSVNNNPKSSKQA